MIHYWLSKNFSSWCNNLIYTKYPWKSITLNRVQGCKWDFRRDIHSLFFPLWGCQTPDSDHGGSDRCSWCLMLSDGNKCLHCPLPSSTYVLNFYALKVVWWKPLFIATFLEHITWFFVRKWSKDTHFKYSFFLASPSKEAIQRVHH